MKKFYIFLTVFLFASAISVSGQRVILRISNNYEVNIDGRYYAANETVPALSYGQHTVKLYEVKPGILGIGKRRTLISTSSFEMRENDVFIETDQYGKLRISQAGNQNNRTRTRDRNNNDYGDYDNQTNTQKRNGKGYGPYNNPGRGHKYGLYKKDQEKRHKKYDNEDQEKDHEKYHNKDNKKDYKKDKKNDYGKENKKDQRWKNSDNRNNN